MTHILTAKERQALSRMEFDHDSFHIKAELGTGIGPKTIESLLELGLIEAGPNPHHYGQIGWRLTDDGWRCIYGETLTEIMAKPDGVKSYPFIVWKWPINSDAQRQRF